MAGTPPRTSPVRHGRFTLGPHGASESTPPFNCANSARARESSASNTATGSCDSFFLRQTAENKQSHISHGSVTDQQSVTQLARPANPTPRHVKGYVAIRAASSRQLQHGGRHSPSRNTCQNGNPSKAPPLLRVTKAWVSRDQRPPTSRGKTTTLRWGPTSSGQVLAFLRRAASAAIHRVEQPSCKNRRLARHVSTAS